MRNNSYRACFLQFAVAVILLLIAATTSIAGLDGDLDSDGDVDMNDLSILSEHWLEDGEPECLGDVDGDCDADFFDFAVLAWDWLKLECSPFTATASSQESPAYSASMAIDGSFSTRWSSVFADNQWLQLDLGQIRSFYGLEIYWETAYADRYNIEVSNDESNWTRVHTDNNGDGGYDNIDFGLQSAQYIRINCVRRATSWGNSIWEVFVKTDDDCTPLGEWTLLWSDEFDGSNIDPANWEHMIGDGTAYGLPAGWGNNELQYYTSHQDNSYVTDGNLVIVARKNHLGHAYTSARLRTKNKQDFLYGRIEARIKVPSTKGIWPAFWMLPSDWEYGGWPISGEIDIMESINTAMTIYGAIHFGNPYDSIGDSYADGTNFSDDFHIYRLDWEQDVMRWYVDDVNTPGTSYLTQWYTGWYSSGAPGNNYAPFDKRFHILLNVAVGGNWPGYPDGSSVFPQQMVVDWIRVYRKLP